MRQRSTGVLHVNDLYRRWFERPSIQAAVSCMLRRFENVPPAQSDHVRNERAGLQLKNTGIAVGGAVLFLVMLIGVLLLCAPTVPGREADYGCLALLCFGVVGGAGVITYLVSGMNNQCRAQRDEAFEELCRRHPGLQCARRVEVDDGCVGTVPWFHSEEGRHAYGLVSGEYQGSRIVTVECTHVVDPILAATDSRLLQGLASVASSRQKRLFLHAMQATVFVEPLPHVSDLLFVPRQDASRAYYRRALERQNCDLDDVFRLPRSLRNKYWMAAAEPGACGALFATELPGLLASRKWCMVQVVGGHCVVMTSHWHGNHPGRAPSTVEEIAADLEFAHAVYQQLKQSSTSVVIPPSGMGDCGERVTGRSTPATQAAESATAAHATVAPRRKNPRRRRPHSALAKCCLLGIGVPLFLVGLLMTTVYFTDRQKGLAAAAWPQADARIVDSGVEVDARHRGGKKVERYKPRVSYEFGVDGERFTGNRINFGIISPTEDKKQADRVLARYPKQALVKVHYLAECPRFSVLEPGVQQDGTMIACMCVTGTCMLIGLFLSGYALIGKRIPGVR
jgi:hypothetical protein